MKIAVVVHGRFHAFDFSRELLRRGHDVTLLTNYPKWAVRRWGVSGDRVRSFWPEGVLVRAARVFGAARLLNPFFESRFGRWAAEQVRRETWDAALCWSGVGEETIRGLEGRPTLRICHRTSAHIRVQERLLMEERERTGAPVELPQMESIAREEREYALADRILVPSSFVLGTFLQQGFPSEKLWIVLLGADTRMFRPAQGVLQERIERILSGAPLRVLNVGTFCFEKGMNDLAQVIGAADPSRFRFRFVGPISSEAAALAQRLRGKSDFAGKCRQDLLPAHYAWADLFLLPSIQDGFQLVLGQASAAGLPILTTPHGAGRDLVSEGRTGWVVPIRSPGALSDRLRWCDAHRPELAEMARRIPGDYRPRDWADAAEDLEKIFLKFFERTSG